MNERILAIDTATTACSVALFENGQCIASAFEDIGRGHAEKLVPMIATLPGKGKADEIVVNCGPGSFTGVRIGISTAKALALAWGASASGYQCLHLIAAQALAQLEKASGVYVAINGGHGEFFVQNFSVDGVASDGLQSCLPEQALQKAQFTTFVGSAAEKLAELSPDNIKTMELLPDAASVLTLKAQFRELRTSPIYGRAPDAVAKPGP